MSNDATTRVEVCIVGAGPTGLLAANMFGMAGVSVLLVERNAGTSAEAKAISLDDESLRAMARAGLGPWLRDVVSPGTGTRYYGARKQLLFHARGPDRPVHGYAFKSPFAQPALEAALLNALARLPSVRVQFGTEVTNVCASPGGVSVTCSGPTRSETINAKWVLGCDGGRSVVRSQLGIKMRGASLEDRWIVIDTTGDHHSQRYGLLVGDPRRPFVIVPAPNGRCRYEFRLKDGEGQNDQPSLDLVRSLLAPHREIRAEQIERTTIYRFHALVAERWRAGRLFLLGDAAHMMPPFAGQGLNSGVRDANNLVWKLIAVIRGASEALLDTYESERKPHAEATVRLSRRLGTIVMTPHLSTARVRDLAARFATRLSPSRRYLEEMRYRPPQRYREGLVSQQLDRTRRVGTVIGQPFVLDATGAVQPLDQLLGPGFALLAVGRRAWPAPRRVEELAARLGASRVALTLDDFPINGAWLGGTDVDGGLRRELRALDGPYLLIRPDRFIYAAFTAAEAERVERGLADYRLLNATGPRTDISGAVSPG